VTGTGSGRWQWPPGRLLRTRAGRGPVTRCTGSAADPAQRCPGAGAVLGTEAEVQHRSDAGKAACQGADERFVGGLCRRVLLMRWQPQPVTHGGLDVDRSGVPSGRAHPIHSWTPSAPAVVMARWIRRACPIPTTSWLTVPPTVSLLTVPPP
jgi:hypothetical protein